MKPNFFIIGVEKSATTFIQACLAEHPEIFMVPGEVPFFENPDYSEKGIDEFEEMFSQVVGEKVIGIKRPNYLTKPEVAPRIYKHYPGAKLLIIFRDPIKRAISAYFHNINYGFIPPKNIEIGMKKILKGEYQNNYKRAKEITEFSFYSKHLKHYLKYFNKNQIHIALFDDIKKDSIGVLKKMYNFLKVEDSYAPTALNKRPQAVVYSLPRLRVLRLRNSFLYNYNEDRTRLFIKKRGLTDKLFLYLIDQLDNKILSGVFKNKKPELSAFLKKELKNIYKNDVKYLSKFLNRDLGHWLK